MSAAATKWGTTIAGEGEVTINPIAGVPQAAILKPLLGKLTTGERRTAPDDDGQRMRTAPDDGKHWTMAGARY